MSQRDEYSTLRPVGDRVGEVECEQKESMKRPDKVGNTKQDETGRLFSEMNFRGYLSEKVSNIKPTPDDSNFGESPMSFAGARSQGSGRQRRANATPADALHVAAAAGDGGDVPEEPLPRPGDPRGDRRLDEPHRTPRQGESDPPTHTQTPTYQQ